MEPKKVPQRSKPRKSKWSAAQENAQDEENRGSAATGKEAAPKELTTDAGLPPARAPRPGSCHSFVRRQVARSLPGVCEVLLRNAAKGDISTMKLLWQMAELDKQCEPSAKQGKDKKFARELLAKFRQR